MKLINIRHRATGVALLLAWVAGMTPVLAQPGRTTGTPQGAVPSLAHPMVGDGTFLPPDVSVRSTEGVTGFERKPGTRAQIGGLNGGAVTEKVVNITRTDAGGPDERAPVWSGQNLYYSRSTANGRYALYTVPASEPADVNPPIVTPLTDPGNTQFDYYYPALNANANRIAFIRSEDGVAVGQNFDDNGKVWHLYVSDLPIGTGFINTAPLGNTNLRSLTLGRDFPNGAGGRSRFANIGRPAWLGVNDLVFSAKLENDTNYHLFTVNVQSGVIFQLTAGNCSEENPAVSPNGQFIAFDSNSEPLTTGESYVSAPGDINRRPRTEADPNATPAVGTNPGSVRNIFVMDPLGRDIQQFTGRYSGHPAVNSVEPAWSSSNGIQSFSSGNQYLIGFSSNRIPTFDAADVNQSNITGWAVGPANTSSIFYVTFIPNIAAPTPVRQTENTATGFNRARLLDTVNSTLVNGRLNDLTKPVFRDRFPTWSPIVALTRMALQSNRNGSYSANGFGGGFTVTPVTLNNLFIASLIDITAPTLIRYDTSSPTGEIVHINLVTDTNNPFKPGRESSVRSREQGIVPSSLIHFAVRVEDREAGLRADNDPLGGAVYIQIKNPNSKYQSQAQGGFGVEHKEFTTSTLLGFGPSFALWEGSPAQPLNLVNAANGFTMGPEYECQAISVSDYTYFGHRLSNRSPGPGRNVLPIPGIDDRNAFAGVGLLPLDGNGGRANVWLKLSPLVELNPDGTQKVDANGNPIPIRPSDGSGGVLYGATWRTPAEASDWYIDVITYDNAANPFNPAQRSNVIIYDNVWGFSTAAPISGGQVDVLVVMDYALGQKFFGVRAGSTPGNILPLNYGAESYYTDIEVNTSAATGLVVPNMAGATAPPAPGGTDPRFWNAPNAFRVQPAAGQSASGVPGGLSLPNTLGVGGYNDEFLASGTINIDGAPLAITSRYSIWRILSRGPVPLSLMQDYLPQVINQPADSVDLPGIPAEQNPRTLQHSTRFIVWASPFSGNLFVGPGTITDIQTQNNLETFVTSGGRLFISGQDIGFALVGAGQSNRFFSNVLKARYNGDSAGGVVGLNAADTATTFNGNYVGQLRENQWSNGNIAFGRFDVNTPFVYTPLNATSQVSDIPYTNLDPTATNRMGDGAATAGGSGAGGRLDVIQANPSTTPANLPNTTPPDATDEFLYSGSAQPPAFAAPGVAPTVGTNQSAIITASHPIGTSAVGVKLYDSNVPFTPQGKIVYMSAGFESVSQGWYTFATTGTPAQTFIASFGRRTELMFSIGNLFRTGTITGRVIDNNGTAVGGALVRAVFGGPNFNQKAAGTAITDGAGNFQIVGLQPGFYSVFASRPGFYTQHDLGNSVHGGWRSNTTLTLKRAGPGSLTGIPGTNGSQGGIFEADGVTPIGGIEVQLRWREADGRFQMVTAISSDGVNPTRLSDGTTVLLPKGAYRFPSLLVIDTNSGYQVIANPTTTVDSAGNVVNKTPDVNGNLPNFNPIYAANIRVQTAPQPEVRKGPGTTVVDPNPNNPNGIGPVLVVRENETATIDFLLPSAPQRVTGQVVDQDTNQPIANAVITAALDTDPSTVVATAVTDANGNYTLSLVNPSPGADPTLLPGGNYIITATVNGYSTSVPPSAANGVPVKVGGSTAPSVTAPQIRLKKLPPGSVSGLVRLIDGTNNTTNGVGGATITLYAVTTVNGQQQQAANPSYTGTVAATPTTAPDGYVYNYKIDNVDPGDYNAYVSKTGLTGSPSPFVLTVTTGQETRNVNFLLQPPKIYGAGIQLISVPQDYSSISTPTIFGFPANGNTDTDPEPDFLVTTWLAEQNRYDPVNGAPNVPLNLGRGYFVRFPSVAPVIVPGTPNTAPTFTISLANNWNLIGHPFTSQADPTRPEDPAADIDISNPAQVTFTYTTTGGVSRTDASLAQAIADNAVQGVVYSYTGSNAGSNYVQGTILRPWFGYWFRAYVPVQMKLNYPGAGSRAVKVNGKYRSMTIEERERPVYRAIDSKGLNDWRIQIAAQQGDLRDTDNSIGVSPNATDGFDNRFDNEKPPAISEGPSVYVAVLGTNSAGRASTFSDNIKSANGQTRTWEFTVEANGGSGDVTVTWPNIARLPRGIEPVLVDTVSNKRVAMRGTSSYRFAPQGRGQRKFVVEVLPPTSLPLDILNLQTSPTRSLNGTSYRFSFMATRAVDVNAEVKTLTGRTVRRFRTRAAGGATTNLSWDGRDDRGSLTPPGPYVLSITAQDERGGKVTRTATFMTMQ